jgi:porin
VQGLQVNANNAAAFSSGSQQGSNSLVAPPPFDRTELYGYALSQYLFDKQVRILVGKLAPSNDFANVVVPVAEGFGSSYWIPAISSLTYTPLYAMPVLQGRLPGYPNSALGASLLIQPDVFNRDVYLKVGAFDGRAGTGVEQSVQTGMSLPGLSGPLFTIGEFGGSWTLGAAKKPGAVGLGLWRQSGPLRACGGKGDSCAADSSAAGGYLIAQQRLLNFRYPHDNSGISTFLQAGWSPANTNMFTTSIGGGFTMFAPMRSRPKDSYGVGLSWARINDQGPLGSDSNPTELMLQVYGQVHLVSNLYLTPSITVLPRVGASNATAPSTSALLQLVALF